MAEETADDNPQYIACSFALGRGQYCKGDVRWPHTHSTLCPNFKEMK